MFKLLKISFSKLKMQPINGCLSKFDAAKGRNSAGLTFEILKVNVIDDTDN